MKPDFDNHSFEDWLEAGRIVGAHGLKGEVRVYPNSDFPERFIVPGERWLLTPGAAVPQKVQLQQGRYLSGKGLYIVKFAQVDYRDQAEALRDSRLLVSPDDRLPLEAGEFHVADLIGLTVVLQSTGATVGTVVDLYSAGNDLLLVELAAQSDAPQTVLIPFVEAIVPTVDLANGRVEIDPPAGLLP
ncbi:MAG: ribosome maturation factor RimM [Leptolyngbya sp. SIO4C1]|nr:ribosome maturation factor RimM [Leptolyngbya sp. SIO4C1]